MKQADLFGAPLPAAPKTEKPAAAPARDSGAIERARPAASDAASAPLGVTGSAPGSNAPSPNERLTPAIAQQAPERTPAWRATEPEAAPKKAPTNATRRVLSVTELTLRIKDVLEPGFAKVMVRGEVSGFRGANARGHLYFSIKDASSTLDVRIWQTMARGLKFKLRDGLAVIVEGALNVYEPQGRYSLIAQRIEPEGVGAQALAFEQLKEKLLAEGLFGEKRTKPKATLPLLPKRIGVVTSLSGAALRDFLKVVHRRHPRLSVLVCDARVQGEDAAFEVARAIRWMSWQQVDAIVVTRGGGSADDLWTFNEERVARAIFACQVPVVSAVGHEVDVTIADLVADVRAPTPSAAAELVVPVVAELELHLSAQRLRLRRALERRLADAKHRLHATARGLGEPRRHLANERLRLNELADRSTQRVRRQLSERHRQLSSLLSRLQRVAPQAQLKTREAQVRELERRLVAATRRRLATETKRLARLRWALEAKSPLPRVPLAQSALEQLHGRLAQSMRAVLVAQRQRHDTALAQLEALSPLAVLSRGYAIARDAQGRVVRSAGDVSPGDPLSLRLHEGTLAVEVVAPKPTKK